MTLFHADTPMIHAPCGADRAMMPGAVFTARVTAFVSRRVANLRAASHRRRDEAALEALPFDLRKDLGWPAGDTAKTR